MIEVSGGSAGRDASRSQATPLTVVIPTHNYAEYLGRAVESALRACREIDRVIVVDDGSTDDTPALLDAFGARIERIRQDRAGVSAARNRGAREASGDSALVFLDADDELLPGALDALRGPLDRGADIDLVVGGWSGVDGDAGGRVHVPGALDPSSSPDARRTNVARFVAGKLAIATGGAAVRRRVFERAEFPVGLANFEDRLFFALVLSGGPAAACDGDGIVLRVHAHAGRQRRRVEAIANSVAQLGEILVADPRFAPLRPWAKRIRSRAALDLFRAYYRSGRFAEAAAAFREARALGPRDALRWSHLRRYARCLLTRSRPAPTTR